MESKVKASTLIPNMTTITFGSPTALRTVECEALKEPELYEDGFSQYNETTPTKPVTANSFKERGERDKVIE